MSIKEQFIANFITKDRWLMLVQGLGETFLITFLAVILGFAIGMLTAVIRSAHDQTGKLKIPNAIAVIYTTVIRGTPTVVQLLIIYFVIFGSVNISKTFCAVLAFGLNSGAYVCEIVRSGIMSVDMGQTEAGRSLGLSYGKTMRYIIFPQAIKNVLPALGNEFITLFKETSIAGYIGMVDLTRAGDLIRAQTFSAFMPLIGVALIYLIFVGIFTKILGIIERSLRKNER
ncbi:MAG: amino acid ABC transporter permease [Eubacterium sp.]|nr:amino acid ABC transporter permease [Eubacterium sp.]